MEKRIYLENGVFNVGGFDASMRVLLGMALILTVLLTEMNGLALFFTAILAVPTVFFGIIRWDPIYKMLNISTCKKSVSFSIDA